MNRLPPVVVECLRSLGSIEAVDVLMILFRSPETFWVIPAIAAEAQLTVTATARILETLHARGLLSTGGLIGACRYAPLHPSISSQVAAIAAMHARDRDALVALLQEGRQSRAAEDRLRRH